ncbi:MAG: hypothetical protein AAGL24_23650 [Pseudomonadota bacterium]
MHPMETRARLAIDYTRGALGLTPSNSPRLSPRSQEHFWDTCVDPGRQITDAQYRTMSIDYVRATAQRAIKDQCGNCLEYAAVVFEYLYLLGTGGRALELAAYQRPGDHVFVVLGRRSGRRRDALTWNDDALIADAWANRIVTPQRYYVDMAPHPHAVHPPRVNFRYIPPRECRDMVLDAG